MKYDCPEVVLARWFWRTALHIMAMHMYTQFLVILPKDVPSVRLLTNPPPSHMGDPMIRPFSDRCIKKTLDKKNKVT